MSKARNKKTNFSAIGKLLRFAKPYGPAILLALFFSILQIVATLFAPVIIGILTPDALAAALAVQVLRIGLLAEPLYGVSIVAAGALRGTGDTLVPSLMNLGSIWVVRLGLAVLLVGNLGLHGMWIAMAVELCVRGLLMLYRQKTSKYYKKGH